MEDYNPFSGTPSIDFDAIEKKSKESSEPKQSAAAAAVEAAPAEPEHVEDYSPFAGNTNLYTQPAAPNPPLQGANGSQFGLSAGPSGSSSSNRGSGAAPQNHKPSSRRPSAPMGYSHGPVGLDGNPLPQSNSAPRPAASPYGAPAPSPYGAPPPSPYGAPSGPGGAPPQQGYGAPAYGSPPPQNYGPPAYGSPPPQGYGAPSQYGGMPAPAYGAAGAYGAPPQQGYGAPQGTWPPQPGNGGSYGLGMRPPQIDNLKWNWGAFLLPVFWAWAYGVQPWAWRMTAFVVFSMFGRIGIIGSILFIVGSFYLGLNGHSLAWQNKNHDSYEHFIGVQRKWLYAGLIVHGVIWLMLIIASATLVASFQNALGHGSVPSYTAPSGSVGGSDSNSGDGGTAAAPTTSAPPADTGGDAGSAGAYGVSGDSGAGGGFAGTDGGDAPSGFHPKN